MNEHIDNTEALIAAQAEEMGERSKLLATERAVVERKLDAKVITSPAARQWLYGVLVAGGAVAVGYGLLTAEQAGLWLALAGAALIVGPGLAAINVTK